MTQRNGCRRSKQVDGIGQEEAVAELWRRGILTWKLHPGQERLYAQFLELLESSAKVFVSHCGRQFGKSAVWLLDAIGLAIREPEAVSRAPIKYAAPTQKVVREILLPLARLLSKDAPRELKPRWKKQDARLIIPATGAEIIMAGTDGGHIDNLRGVAMARGYVDEAGFTEEALGYVVNDVLMPQTATTRGCIVLSSNSPKMVAHPFRQYAAQAKARGAYFHGTIHDNPYVEPEELEALKDAAGGEQSTTWRREYLAEWVTDEATAVVPEFTHEKQLEIVREWERPPHSDAYVAMDVGFRDFTGVLFGYWDFRRAVGVIEDELVLRRMTTEELAEGIRRKERELWEDKPPLQRVSDVELILIHDLTQLHGLQFYPTRKDDKDAAINAVRLAIQQSKLVMHPRCVHLQAHLESAVWNRSRTRYERSELFGHYDLVDALVYWWRSVDQRRNPYPADVARFDQFQMPGPPCAPWDIAAALERSGNSP